MKGKVVKLGDHINTDFVISGKYKFKTQDMTELAKHVFEDLDPTLAGRITQGTIIVAGRNFGCGSSREHAARLIKRIGVQAVIAKSFARIFYRNAINIGLPAIVVSEEFVDSMNEGDELEIDLDSGKVTDMSRHIDTSFKPFPETVSKILMEGGIAAYVRKHGVFPWDTE